jgi:N,N'-diacetyllegionaminate synthase
LVSKFAKKAAYQTNNSKDEGDSQLSMLEKLELGKKAHYILRDYSDTRGIKFLSTGFDPESLEFLNEFGINLFKIPSGEITNLPYLRQVGNYGKPVILSTGMAEMNEIKEAIKALLLTGLSRDFITALHCSTEYPTPFNNVNLRAMQSMKKELGVKIGYSDHTLGIEVPIAAAAMGATVIEKHFTLDRNMEGPDHRASLEPKELKEMVISIRNIEQALGQGIKKPSAGEMENRGVVRKSIVASRNISKGEVLTEENLSVKRPGTGISPMEWDKIIGTKAMRDYEQDDLI